MARLKRMGIAIAGVALVLLLAACKDLLMKSAIEDNVERYNNWWHGGRIAVSAASLVFNPQLAIDGSDLFLSYSSSAATIGGIGIQVSANEGMSWSAFSGGNPAAVNYPHVLGARNGAPHVFYYKTSATTGVHYLKCILPSWFDIESYNSSSADANGMLNGDMLVAPPIFIAWYDSSTSALLYSFCPLDPFLPGPPPPVAPFLGSAVNLTGGATGRSGGQFPSLRVDSNGNLYVLYADTTVGSNRVVLLTASSTNLNFGTGATSVSQGPLTPGSVPGDANITRCSLAITGSPPNMTVHAVWTQLTPGNYIYYSRAACTNLAVAGSWSAPLAIGIENNWCGKTLPFEAQPNGKLYLLHQNNGSPATSGIRLSSSSNGGSTWSHRTLDGDGSFATSSGFASSMALKVSGTVVYVAYSTGSSHPNGYSITMMKSINSGVSW